MNKLVLSLMFLIYFTISIGQIETFKNNAFRVTQTSVNASIFRNSILIFNDTGVLKVIRDNKIFVGEYDITDNQLIIYIALPKIDNKGVVSLVDYFVIKGEADSISLTSYPNNMDILFISKISKPQLKKILKNSR